MAALGPFVDELRQARLAQSARLEATLGLEDAKVLRLGALRDGVMAALAGNERALELFELSAFPGAGPRLWVDLVSAVVMEPDPKHYRLVQDQAEGRAILFETESLDAMKAYLVKFLAHRLVEQERARAKPRPAWTWASGAYSHLDLALVWLAGLGFGILAVVGWAIGTGRLGF